jgi:hypothetical protein
MSVLSKKRSCAQATEVNSVEEGDINDLVGEIVVIQDMIYRKAKKSISTPNRRQIT